MLREIRFRYRHDGCWLQETTERHPSLLMVASSMYMNGDEVHGNLTLHAPNPAIVKEAHKEWLRDPRIRKVTLLREDPHGTRFHVAYHSDKSIFQYLMDHTPVSMGATRFANGVEHYHIIGESTDLQELLAALAKKGKVEVTSVRETDLLAEDGEPTPGVLGALTDKQVEALILAYRQGYYQWPRRRSASDLATGLGLSSSAFLDHLRHAEAKLIEAVMADLAVRDPGRAEAVRTVKAKAR